MSATVKENPILERKKVWDLERWSLWQWTIDKQKPVIAFEFSLFHNCILKRDHRVITHNDGSAYCGECLQQPPDSAIALLELLNWDRRRHG